MTLQDFFAKHPKAALAYSGGVDSSYLLYAAKQYGADVCAYFVKSSFQPEFELKDARRLAEMLEVSVHVLEVDILSDSVISDNPKDRCYYCKKKMLSCILQAARQDGYSVLLDGTNASDDVSDRPGMRALEELFIYSPLKLCGLQKEEIRRLSKEAGLFTWDKAAYACLATRIATGTPITEQRLYCIEQAEQFLYQLGCRDFRVRLLGTAAKLEVSEADLTCILEHRAEIVNRLKEYFDTVLLDLEVRR